MAAKFPLSADSSRSPEDDCPVRKRPANKTNYMTPDINKSSFTDLADTFARLLASMWKVPNETRDAYMDNEDYRQARRDFETFATAYFVGEENHLHMPPADLVADRIVANQALRG